MQFVLYLILGKSGLFLRPFCFWGFIFIALFKISINLLGRIHMSRVATKSVFRVFDRVNLGCTATEDGQWL